MTAEELTVAGAVRVADVARTLNDARPLRETLDAICSRVAGLPGCDFATIRLEELPGGPMRVWGSFGMKPEYLEWIEEVDRGTVSFLADLERLVGAVVIVEPLPETSEPMIYCLTTGADPDSCSLPAISQPGTAEVEARWERLAGVSTISLDDLICPLGTCPAMTHGLQTHLDAHHLSGKYARYLAHPLDAYLRARGIVLATGEVAQ